MKKRFKKYLSSKFIILYMLVALLAIMAWCPWIEGAASSAVSGYIDEHKYANTRERPLNFRKVPFGMIVETTSGCIVCASVGPLEVENTYFVSPFLTVHELPE